MKIKCILFDTDGVVVNSEMFSEQYQKQFDISNDVMLPFFKGVFQDCLIGKADLKEAVKSYLKDWKWAGTADELLQFWFKSEHCIDAQIIDLIKNLQAKSIKCYLATNQEKYRTEYMKTQMGFKDTFSHIFSSVEVGYKKPDKKFYEAVFNQINKSENIAKKEMLLIDDSKENVDEAASFGIKAHLYTGFDNLSNEIVND